MCAYDPHQGRFCSLVDLIDQRIDIKRLRPSTSATVGLHLGWPPRFYGTVLML